MAKQDTECKETSDTGSFDTVTAPMTTTSQPTMDSQETDATTDVEATRYPQRDRQPPDRFESYP